MSTLAHIRNLQHLPVVKVSSLVVETVAATFGWKMVEVSGDDTIEDPYTAREYVKDKWTTKVYFNDHGAVTEMWYRHADGGVYGINHDDTAGSEALHVLARFGQPEEA